MKRLQVGDECYVRDAITNKIHICEFGIGCHGTEHEGQCKVKNVGMSIDVKDKQFMHRIVYPYPIIKQLAK